VQERQEKWKAVIHILAAIDGRNLRACLKMGNSPAAVLLATAFVGPASTARFGDALTVPPRQPPKLPAPYLIRIFRQALGVPLVFPFLLGTVQKNPIAQKG
jgi:hypothetical protein